MEVKLINGAYLQEEMELAGWIASVSTDTDSEPEKVGKFCVRAKHGTPTRAMRFIFEINGVSRVLSHELVRHEIGFIKCQRSQRYVKEDGFKYVTPTELHTVAIPYKNDWLSYDDIQSLIRQFYLQAVDNGVKPEMARYILSGATHTSIRCSIDWEALVNFIEKRTCFRAQKEIRELAEEMRRQVIIAYPFFEDKLGKPCENNLFCDEIQCCGYGMTRKEAIERLKGDK